MHRTLKNEIKLCQVHRSFNPRMSEHKILRGTLCNLSGLVEVFYCAVI